MPFVGLGLGAGEVARLNFHAARGQARVLFVGFRVGGRRCCAAQLPRRTRAGERAACRVLGTGAGDVARLNFHAARGQASVLLAAFSVQGRSRSHGSTFHAVRGQARVPFAGSWALGQMDIARLTFHAARAQASAMCVGRHLGAGELMRVTCHAGSRAGGAGVCALGCGGVAAAYNDWASAGSRPCKAADCAERGPCHVPRSHHSSVRCGVRAAQGLPLIEALEGRRQAAAARLTALLGAGHAMCHVSALQRQVFR